MERACRTGVRLGGLTGRSRGPLVGAALLLGATALGAAPPQQQIQEDLEVERLAEGVWLHTSYEELEDYGRVPANGLVVVSDGEAAFIDTPWTDDQTRALAGWVKDSLGARLTTVILTHSHADCMGGLGAAHELGARSYSSARTVEIARSQNLPAPRESFDDGHDIALGSRVLEARFVGPGHTVDTIVVWLPDDKILFGGDLVRSASARSLGYTREADLERWPDTLAALQSAYEEAVLIVPGHGRPGGMELLDHTRELLAGELR